MFGAGALSDAYGRKTVMAASLFAAAAATLAAALAPNWPTLIAARALTGLALSGAPAVAMAYLAEEMDRSAIGLSMGLFIAGNTLGGMGGRLAAASIVEFWGWRWALGAIGLSRSFARRRSPSPCLGSAIRRRRPNWSRWVRRSGCTLPTPASACFTRWASC